MRVFVQRGRAGATPAVTRADGRGRAEGNAHSHASTHAVSLLVGSLLHPTPPQLLERGVDVCSCLWC